MNQHPELPPAVAGPLLAAGARLAAQIGFIVEIDRLKHVLRRSLLTDGSRRENDAEHSWHMAVMAMVLAEHAAEPVEIGRVVRMLLVHDLVEIDAGDTFLYDTVAAADQEEREQRAADRIFGLLPAEQEKEFRALWDEFEARATPDAKFARALDRLQPMLHNFLTQGGSWKEYGVRPEQVLARKRLIADGAPALWALAETLVAEAVRKGYFGAG